MLDFILYAAIVAQWQTAVPNNNVAHPPRIISIPQWAPYHPIVQPPTDGGGGHHPHPHPPHPIHPEHPEHPIFPITGNIVGVPSTVRYDEGRQVILNTAPTIPVPVDEERVYSYAEYRAMSYDSSEDFVVDTGE